MNIQYEITRDDIWNFNKYVMLNVPGVRRVFLTNMISVPLIVLAVGLFMRFNKLYLGAAIIVSTVVFYFLVMFLMKRKVVKLNSEKPGLLGNHEMEISTSGLKVKSASNDSTNSWKKIKNIADTKHYIYFFITDQFAYIIPKKSFVSQKDAEEFLSTSKEYLTKYGGKR